MFYLHTLGYLYLSLVLLADPSTSSAKQFIIAFLVWFLLLHKALLDYSLTESVYCHCHRLIMI
nr:MAG TPA: hypothetical protein [Caudoviricetes sp.]